MAFPVFQQAGTIGTGTDFSCDVPYPSTVNADDIIIASIMDADNDTFDTPAGWTKFDEDSSNNNMSFALYWLRADGTETGTVTFTSLLNSGSLVAGIMYRYSGCVKVGIPLQFATSNPVSQSSTLFVSFGSNDPDALQRLAVGIGIVEDNTINGFTPGGDTFTEDSRLSTSVGSDAHFAVCSLEVGATAPATPNWSMSSSEYKAGISLYLIPEGDVPVTLNTPADLEDIGDDTTPTVEFTPNAVSDLDNEVEVQFDTVNTFDSQGDSKIVIDSYDGGSLSQYNYFLNSIHGKGQSFSATVTGFLVSTVFVLDKDNLATGFVKAKLYSHSGTFGTSSIGVDLLATSDFIDVSTIGSAPSDVEFFFTDHNQYELVNGEKYVMMIYYEDSTASNNLNIGIDNTSPTHSGNSVEAGLDRIPDDFDASVDIDFTVYVDTSFPLIDALSETDAGFLNTVNPAIINTYHFDGSDAGAIDPDNVWTDETNTDDGSISTYGYTSTVGSSTTNEIIIEGTNAPASGATIDIVRVRCFGKSPSGSPEWSDYENLSIPSGGWTWAKVQALETVFFKSAGFDIDVIIYTDGLSENIGSLGFGVLGAGETRVYKVEIDVITGDFHPFNDNEKLSFTVQAGDELPYGTVYWRVRAINPTGINVFDDWSAIRSFDIVEGGGSTVLVVQDSLHDHDADNIDLTQANTLVVQDSLHGHLADNIDLTQKNTLVVNDTLHAHSVDGDLVVVQMITLIVADTLHGHTADNIDLTQSNTLAINDSLHDHLSDNIDLTQKNTLVVQDSVHAHTVDNIDIMQTFTLVVQESNHAHTVDNLDLVQKHILAVFDTLHSHTVDNIILTQSHILAIQDSLHAHLADNIALTQKNTLVVVDSLHSHTADNIDLSQGYTLIVNDSLHSHTADNITLTQKNTLAVNDTLHAHSADNIILEISSFNLVVQDSLHGHLVDNIDLLQSNTLVVADTLHSHSVDNIDLVEQELLTVQDSLHDHTADNVVLTQKNVLAVDGSNHAHSVDNIDLIQKNTLVSDDSLHAHSADNITLSISITLVVEDTLHDHSADGVVLTQKNVLNVADSLHGHTADNIVLVQNYTLVVQDSVHSHSADNIILTQSNILDVQDSLHGHTVDNIELVQKHTLSVDDSLHGHLADNITLAQSNLLAIQDSLHNHLADNITLALSFLLEVQDSDHIHLADNIDLVQSHTLFVNDTLHSHTADNVTIVLGSENEIIRFDSLITKEIRFEGEITLISEFTGVITLINEFDSSIELVNEFDSTIEKTVSINSKLF